MSCLFEEIFYNKLKDQIKESKYDAIKKGLATGLVGLSTLINPANISAHKAKNIDTSISQSNINKKMENVEQKIDKLIPFLKKVESNNKPDAKGDYLKGVPRSLGVLQIRQGVIDDVNKAYNDSYIHEDAFDVNKAEDICKKYLMLYTKRINNPSLEILARIWNGGPKGYIRSATNDYWKKVQKEIVNTNK